MHVLPTLWFRNTWTWWPDTPKPSLKQSLGRRGFRRSRPHILTLGERYLYCEGDAQLLFTENETNNERIFGTANASPYVKDAIDNYVVQGKQSAVNPGQTGTKSAAHYEVNINAGATARIRLRLSDVAPSSHRRSLRQLCANHADPPGARQMSSTESITPTRVSQDEALVMRQALAGMLWSKQFFFFDVDKWLKEHREDPMKPGTRAMRNTEWFHMLNQNVISMPDKWEYPWYAAWDLAFHTIALSLRSIRTSPKNSST